MMEIDGTCRNRCQKYALLFHTFKRRRHRANVCQREKKTSVMQPTSKARQDSEQRVSYGHLDSTRCVRRRRVQKWPMRRRWLQSLPKTRRPNIPGLALDRHALHQSTATVTPCRHDACIKTPTIFIRNSTKLACSILKKQVLKVRKEHFIARLQNMHVPLETNQSVHAPVMRHSETAVSTRRIEAQEAAL